MKYHMTFNGRKRRIPKWLFWLLFFTLIAIYGLIPGLVLWLVGLPFPWAWGIGSVLILIFVPSYG